METTVSLSVLLAVVGLILSKLLPWIIQKNNGSKNDHELLMELHQMTSELYDWHSKHGDEAWYIQRSLDKAIEKLAESADAQLVALRDISRTQQETVRLLERLNDGQK
jgi:hypothetical protein